MKFLANFLIKSVQILKAIWKYIRLVILLIAKPFMALGKFLLKPIILRTYKIYLKIRAAISKSPLLQNKLAFFVYNRHVVHVIIVIIALFVTSTNLVLGTEVSQRQEVAKKSNLYNIVKQDMGINDDKIVEKAKPKKQKKKNYVKTDGLVVATIPEVTKKQQKDEIIFKDQGTTLAATSILEEDVSTKRGGVVEYKVQTGDTASEIAAKYGITTSTLLWENGLSSNSSIQPGKTLRIPPDTGIYHEVESGDTLESIVKKHEGDLDEVKKANKDIIDSEGHIAVGVKIFVPEGKPYTPPAPAPAKYASSGSSSSSSGWGLFSSGSSTNVTGGTLNWPSSCRRISQGVRWGHIAIDINCGFGQAIYAAESGTVSVIPNRGNGYGNYIIINHGGGMSTLYGHLSSFTVQNGAYVSRGQQIGVEGSTGWSTGPHLHFEVHNPGQQNPWNYL